MSSELQHPFGFASESHSTAGFHLRVEDLIVWVPKKRKFNTKLAKKPILKGLNAQFAPGSMTAIVGPSGSGKTTFLNFLAGRQDASQEFLTSCRYFVHGIPFESLNSFKNIIGYVTQDDILETRHSPRETFKYYARLRGQPDPEASAQRVIRAMHLEKCQNTPVGDVFTRGLSGGEKKRTSIGVELISNPKLLFLDEPTTGLDSATALDIIMNVAELKHEGMTVVATLHQPSEELLALFDQVLFLVEGFLVFGGRPADLEARLVDSGLEKRVFETPLEAFMKAVDKDDLRARALASGEAVDETKIAQFHDERIRHLSETQDNLDRKRYEAPVADPESLALLRAAALTSNRMIPFCKQFWIIFGNYFYIFNSQPRGMLMRVFMMTMILVFLIIVFIRSPSAEEDPAVSIQNYGGILFMLNTNLFMGGNANSSYTIIATKAVFRKDAQARMYSRGAYFLAVSSSIVPFYFGIIAILGTIYFFVFRFNFDPHVNYLWFLAFLELTNLAGTSMGMLVAAIAEKFSDISALSPVTIAPMFLVSGFLANILTVSWPIRIYSYIAPTRFLFQGIILNHFQSNEVYLQNCKVTLPCLHNQRETCVYRPPIGSPLTNQCDPFVRFNFEQKSVWLNFIIALVLTLGWRTLAYVVFLIRYRERPTVYGTDDELSSQFAGRVSGSPDRHIALFTTQASPEKQALVAPDHEPIAVFTTAEFDRLDSEGPSPQEPERPI